MPQEGGAATPLGSNGHKTALITGGARGIGFACAQAFAREGWSVAIADTDADALQAAARRLRDAGARALPVTADVGAVAQVEAALRAVAAEFGGLTVLVNNDGYSEREPSAKLTLEQWDKMLAVHLTGAFLCCRAAYPLLCRTQGAAIVNIASIAAFVALPQTLAYSVAKAGIMALTRVLAVEWAPDGIRVNAVAPAWTETALVQHAVEIGTVSRESITRRIPMNRLAQPEEVANTVYFLCSDGGGFVTGQTLLVDGGFTIDGRL